MKKRKVKIDTFMKLITSVVVVHGLAMVTMSYILSWFGKDPVCEVSVTLIAEIVAPIVTYFGCNTVMNIFEKNHLSFSMPLAHKKEETEAEG